MNHLKLAEHNRMLAEYHDDEEEETTGEEDETNDANLTLEEELRKLFNITIGGIVIAFGTGILGYDGDVMTIKNIMTVGKIGFLGYCVGLSMCK